MPDLDARLDACRQRGLTVDDDFEHGITTARKVARTVVALVALAAVTATGIVLVSPDRFFDPSSATAPPTRPLKARVPHHPLKRQAHTVSPRANA